MQLLQIARPLLLLLQTLISKILQPYLQQNYLYYTYKEIKEGISNIEDKSDTTTDLEDDTKDDAKDEFDLDNKDSIQDAQDMNMRG